MIQTARQNMLNFLRLSAIMCFNEETSCPQGNTSFWDSLLPNLPNKKRRDFVIKYLR